MSIKKIYQILSLAGMVGLAIACQTGEPFDLMVDEQIPISLSSDINQLAVTRASDNGFASGDQVGVWAVNYEGDTPGTLDLKDNQATNVRFTYNGSSWASDYDIYYKDKNTKVDIYGIYPYTSAISSIDAQPFEVQEDQSTISAHGSMGGYEASDFLWAKREAVTPSPSTVQLLFQHKMSCVVVTLEEGSGFEAGEFAILSQSVLINNVKRSASINLATGVVTAIGAVPARSTIPAAYEGGFRAIVVPQTVSSASSLFSITLGGTSYTYSQGSAFEYVAGKQHNFNVTVDKKADGGIAVTVQTTISAWTNDNSSHDFVAKEYVVVNVETPGTLGEILISSGRKLDLIKNLKVTGDINANDFFFMRDMLVNLASVNMQYATIHAASGPFWFERYDAQFSVEYPDNTIPQSAFWYGWDSIFDGKKSLTSFIFPEELEAIQENAFGGTKLSGAIILPEGLKEIGVTAFANTMISSITLPQTLVSISESAFNGCRYLVGTLSLPQSLINIGRQAFAGCSGLSGSLNLPEKLEVLGYGAFDSCSGLSGDLIIPTKIKEIDPYVFHSCSFGGRLYLHDGIVRINSEAFSGNAFKGELILPKSITYIGSSAFWGNSFSSISELPETLTTLDNGAFALNPRLSGIITFPTELSIIPEGLFNGCSNLEGIILPASLNMIGANAFNECFQITKIICNASEPPVIHSGAFNGVSKDSFSVEVPESSVNLYTTAAEWKEFKRIVSHQDFSISGRLLRTLNDSEEQFYVVRAESGASWNIESKPDWVAVSPSSGIGKTDVTVTVNGLSVGSGDRNGEVVFLLDGKDYRSTLTVEQYDYEYGDGSVITKQEHSRGTGIPLVFLGDCYDAADIASGSYLSDTEEAMGYFFDIEPYKTYKDYFDVYIVFGKSEDSGVGSVNTIRESKFGTQYSLTGGALQNNGTEAFAYARLANPDMDITKGLVVMVLNSSDYGGVTYMWNDGSAIAICPKSSDPYPYDFRGLVQHEAGGHGFGKLADEYIYVNSFIDACSCSYEHLGEFRAAKANGWYKNLSDSANRDEVPWSHLMYHPDYSNTVDIYEGGFFHTRGIFRSEPNSCMNNNIPYYSAISRQAIVERIMDYAGVPFELEEFYANDVRTVTTKASVNASPSMVPSPSGAMLQRHHHPIIMGDHPTLK